MSPTDWLKSNLTALQLPQSAIDWLVMLFDMIQTFDDFADGDPVDRERLDCLIWQSLIDFHSNDFFAENHKSLTALLATQILKWQGSDTVERLGNADARSYMWRAGYYDIVLFVVQIVHDPAFAIQNAHIVMNLYGETLKDYLKEFEQCQIQ